MSNNYCTPADADAGIHVTDTGATTGIPVADAHAGIPVANAHASIPVANAHAGIPVANATASIPVAFGSRRAAPEWAKLEWKLISRMEEAVGLFLRKYVRDDGTLVWRGFWPGMDGADDAFEAFQNYPLLYALGADKKLLELAHSEWDTVAWQWTEYGQLHREFFAYYDWMHHGEGSLFLYYMGLADPRSMKFKARSLRFASFYDGSDVEAANYDPRLRHMRSPINGSRGPRLRQSAEDWETHRAVLDNYLPPFEDMPGIPFTMGKCDWSGDETYATILSFLNRRMAAGDVPLNLNATSLMAHAYMYTGDEKYSRWISDYLGVWEGLTERNGGVIPDNVGATGAIGEHMDGKWWGGYYGWRWPHGALTVIEPLITAGLNAMLVAGDGGGARRLDLARSQMDFLYEKRVADAEGKPLVPHRHFDCGWTDFRRENTKWPVYMWSVTMDAADRARIARLPDQHLWGAVPDSPGKGNRMDIHPWYHYINGGNPGFPEQTLRANLQAVERRIAEIEADCCDIDAADIHHWQDKNPVICEALAQLMLGGPTNIYHGGLMFTPLRYFTCGVGGCGGLGGLGGGSGGSGGETLPTGVSYAARSNAPCSSMPSGSVYSKRAGMEYGRPGLPRGVGALVTGVDSGGVSVSFYNAGDAGASFVVQGGCFGEHSITGAGVIGDGRVAYSDGRVVYDGGSAAYGGGRMPSSKYLRVELGPGEGVDLRLELKRFSQKPSYRAPYMGDAETVPLITPRRITDIGGPAYNA